MKTVLISLSVLITLSQTDDQTNYVNKDLYLRTGKIPEALLERYADTNFVNKYLDKKRNKDDIDTRIAEGKAKKVQRARESDEQRHDVVRMNNDLPRADNGLRWSYQLDPILNVVRRRRGDSSTSASTEDSESSSREIGNWKEEWQELWNKRKLETKNFTTTNNGDYVNMIAARPWGVPCGDPSEHDMPSGTCLLPAECNAEYRIYKGDYFCGRTQFICCSLNFHTYDLYQGLDVSFDQTEMEIDSAAERERAKLKTSKQRQKATERRRKRRKRLREERKRKIKRTIAKIVKEVRRILDKAYRNASKVRKRKTNTMKKFVKFLKKQYKMDRDSVKDIHENSLLEIDQDFMNKLLQIKEVNSEFMTNDTFRDIIINRTISLRTAETLAESYPELNEFIPKAKISYRGAIKGLKGKTALRMADFTRRRGYSNRPRGARLRGGIVRPINRHSRRKYLDYDVEYGLMYT